MNKKRILGIIIIVLALSMPVFVNSMQDYYIFNRLVPLKNNQTQEILKTHPVISQIYQQVYENPIEENYYVVKEKESYAVEQQEFITKMQTIYANEIQKLVDYEILSYEILEVSKIEPSQIDFGTITKRQSNTILYQVYRMSRQDDKSISYQMDNETNKIIDIFLQQKQQLSFTKQQLQQLAWQMITYLELDDIEDWTYNQDGYESNIAKLRISCTIEKYIDNYTFHIGVNVLGLYAPTYILSNP